MDMTTTRARARRARRRANYRLMRTITTLGITLTVLVLVGPDWVGHALLSVGVIGLLAINLKGIAYLLKDDVR